MDPALLLAALAAAISLIPLVAPAARRVRLPRFPLPQLAACGALLVALTRPAPAGAALPPPPARLGWETAPETDSVYVVRRGDSLWAIARRALAAEGGEPTVAEVDRHWREIYAANRQVVGADPDLIHPGQRLSLPEPG